VQIARTRYGECIKHTSFCIWVKGIQILAIQVVFAKVTITLSPLYGPTVVAKGLVRPTCLKGSRDRSDTWPLCF